MKSIVLVSEDRLGLLADISYILGKSSINIDGLFVDVMGGKAVISVDVKDPKKASGVLAMNGFITTHPDSIVIRASNNSMDKITEMLESEHIQVKEMVLLSSDKTDGIFAVQVDKSRKAHRMLTPFLLGRTANPSYY